MIANMIKEDSHKEETDSVIEDPAAYPRITGIPSVAFEQLALTDKQISQLNKRLDTEAALQRFLAHEAKKISFLSLDPERAIRSAFEFGRLCTSGNPNTVCRRALIDPNYAFFLDVIVMHYDVVNVM
eukprot:GHVP01034350.1.p1 GENE.GHVP01034350.1~~GHVP01034350.1.p1  ORF type:complete len:127 (+),score=16.06 GHVP01034350.1:237-617(+)